MKIFIADYLPLANKGEEEILRGLESLFMKEGDEQISFTVFGDVANMQRVGNVTVFPKTLCYPDYACKGKLKYLEYLFLAILDIIGIYPYKSKVLGHRILLNEFKESDKLLIGHDGFFNIRCAMLGNFLHRMGFIYGILGAGFNKPGGMLAWAYNKVYKKCFDNANYVILREKTAFDYVSSITKNPVVRLFPDPAFFCPNNIYEDKSVKNIISKYDFDNDLGLRIGMTICEDSISFSRAFLESSNRVIDHRNFIVDLIEKISKKWDCTFYFLPHCIKEGKGNDLVIAKYIKTKLSNSVNCKIIEEDLPVLDLKHIISKMDFMIGERTHSIINSIATETPFVSLTCTADFRTHDIIGEGCGLPQQIYDMDYANLNELFAIVDRTINNASKLRDDLKNICAEHDSLRKEYKEII